MFFGFGPWELMIVAVIILLLFSKRIPIAFRSVGKSIVEFKKGIKDDGSEDSKEQDGESN